MWCVLYVALTCPNEVLMWDYDFSNHLNMQYGLANSMQ
jgi:hypothetical protein